MSKLIFYVNGRFINEDDAKISILDLGFVRGYGVFDFLRTYNGKPFKLDDHLKRLENSAKQVGLPILPIAQIRQIVLQTLEKNSLPEFGVKIILTGGESEDQITPSGKPTLAVIVSALPVYPKSFYEDGVKVITVPLVRILPEAKTINYLSAIMAKKLAKEKGAIEAIYSQKSSAYKNDEGEIFEGTQSNFFCFINNVLITPKEGILRGITREVVLEIAENEYQKDLRPIKYKEIKNMEEAFITTTSKEIMPVVKIDEMTVGKGQVGFNTKRLMDLFRKYTKKNSPQPSLTKRGGLFEN